MVDLTFLKKFTKDDPVKMKRYISLYLDVAPKTFAKMQLNLEAGDWEQLRINAHSLKPQAEYMGLVKLKDQLIKIEEAVKLNELNDIQSLLQTALGLSAASEKTLGEILEKG